MEPAKQPMEGWPFDLRMVSATLPVAFHVVKPDLAIVHSRRGMGESNNHPNPKRRGFPRVPAYTHLATSSTNGGNEEI
jgi:hypothetical protein